MQWTRFCCTSQLTGESEFLPYLRLKFRWSVGSDSQFCHTCCGVIVSRANHCVGSTSHAIVPPRHSRGDVVLLAAITPSPATRLVAAAEGIVSQFACANHCNNQRRTRFATRRGSVLSSYVERLQDDSNITVAAAAVLGGVSNLIFQNNQRSSRSVPDGRGVVFASDCTKRLQSSRRMDGSLFLCNHYTNTRKLEARVKCVEEWSTWAFLLSLTMSKYNWFIHI